MWKAGKQELRQEPETRMNVERWNQGGKRKLKIDVESEKAGNGN
jgi:hypothetical protein